MIVAASRLIFAIGRDGILPLSTWVAKVDNNKQPRNAVTVMYIFGACLLCTILPSQVAFTSLTSTAGTGIIAAYGLIASLRFFVTPNEFKWSTIKLGRFAKYFYAASILFTTIVFAVVVSPFFFPVTAQTFNFVSPFGYISPLCGYADLTDFSSARAAGCGGICCSHHLCGPELVVYPRG
jgi:translation initiation factor 5B